MIRVEYHPGALADAHTPSLGMLNAQTEAAAERFEAELRRAAEFAALLPSTGSPGAGGTRRLRLHGFPHTLIYRFADGLVLVLAVAHERREPGYWRRR